MTDDTAATALDYLIGADMPLECQNDILRHDIDSFLAEIERLRGELLRRDRGWNDAQTALDEARAELARVTEQRDRLAATIEAASVELGFVGMEIAAQKGGE